MLKVLLDKLSGTHITIMVGLALLAPSLLYAVPAYQNVAVMDPNTGSRAYVDPARRVYTFDPIAGYANNPANKVSIKFFARASGCSADPIYRVPAGRALIITAVSGYFYQTSNDGRIGFILDEGIGCAKDITAYYTSAPQSQFAPINLSLGSGAIVQAGKSVYVYDTNDSQVSGFMHGYLVPATALPQAGSADTAMLEGPALPASAPGAKR